MSRRWSGRFVVVAAGVRQQDAPGLLLRLDEAFAGDPVQAGGLSLHVSSSLGLVCEPGGAADRSGSVAARAEELLSSADSEMYAHKRSRVGVHRLLQLAETRPDAGG